MKKLIVIVGLIICLLTSCKPAPVEEPAPTIPDVTVPPQPPPVTTEVEPTELELRLDNLIEQLERQQQNLHIPGMAIAVVMDNEIILLKGFGVSDVEGEVEVTPETLFAIGSTTKAFTATMIGMLVDDGIMDWEDPITNYLPYFTMELETEDEQAEITIQDLLSHRTGYPRMGLLFASGMVPREEILQAAPLAEPYAPFRERFYYSNVMFMAAGVALGEAVGSDWDSLITDRIFKPLGMNDSTTSVDNARSDLRLSKGYFWNEAIGEYEDRPMRDVDNIGPSGSITSNAIDMAKWLQFLLNEGTFEGRQLISEQQLLETWTDHIEMAPGINYGLGWILRDWEGEPLIEHGGNVDGFAAQVALFPESNLGFALLTNVSVTQLQGTSINIVGEALLGEVADQTETPVVNYEPYLGEYIANFGQFQDTIFTVAVKNNHLSIDIPGQTTYELDDPDEDGKWYFKISREIAISFNHDQAGNVISLTLEQSGFEFEIPRRGVEIIPEIDLSELQKYLGHYRSEELGVTVEVIIQNNRLAIDWPGEMIYELHPPDEEGIWIFRITDIFSLTFNETAVGDIESLTYYQPGIELELLRVEVSPLPLVDHILELRDTDQRKTALEAMGSYRITGTIHSLQSGVTGSFTMVVSGIDNYRLDIDYGKYGFSSEAVSGEQASVKSSFGPFRQLHGKLLKQATRGHPENTYGDWLDFNDSINVIRFQEINGITTYVLRLNRDELPPITLYIDSTTGDLLRSEHIAISEGDIAIPIVQIYEDYREVFGVHIPFRTISSNEQSGRIVFQYETIEANLDIDSTFFTLSRT